MPLTSWQDTKQTLHRFCQVVGKLQLAATSPAHPYSAEKAGHRFDIRTARDICSLNRLEQFLVPKSAQTSTLIPS